MKYRFMGQSGALVARLTLGTMTFGAPDFGCDEATSHAIMKAYFDAGGNSLDTANIYARGKSEEIIGSFLPQIDREAVFLASKCSFVMADKPNFYGSSRKHIIAACEASLKRLRTDYLDLYYLHGPDPVTPMEETMRALDDLVRTGKVRYAGCSNLFAWQLTKGCEVAKRLNGAGFVAGQYLYNLIHREPEREIIPAAVDAGAGIFTFSPLGGGLLTGKYTQVDKPEAGTRLAHRIGTDGPRFWHPQGFRVADSLREVSQASGIDMGQLAIAWALKRRIVTSVIIGAKTVEQLTQNMVSGDWDMPDDVWTALEERTRPDEDYLTFFNRNTYNRFFAASEFHDEVV